MTLLRREAPEYMRLVDSKYSFGVNTNPPMAGEGGEIYWSNPMESSLPMAPKMAIACMYGVSKPTERAYAYRKGFEEEEVVVEEEESAVAGNGGGEKSDTGTTATAASTKQTKQTKQTNQCRGKRREFLEIDDTQHVGKFGAGIMCEDGDGTVPLESLGVMCDSSQLWNGKTKYNPSGMTIRTKEYNHDKFRDLDLGVNPLNAFVQGGPSSADHVDILGNYHLIDDLLNIVTTKDNFGLPKNKIISKLKGLSKDIENKMKQRQKKIFENHSEEK